MVQAPDVSTESSVSAPDVLDDMHVDVSVGSRWNWRQFCSFVGSSGLVVVAYLDPGNLESDLQIGALSTPGVPGTAFKFLWVLLLATFCGWILQGMSVHVGIYSGTDLCSLTRIRYPRWVSITMWLVAEVAILSADIQAMIGTGLGINSLTGIPLGKSTTIGFFLSFAVFCTKVGIKPLEWIFFCLLLATGSIFISAAVVSRPAMGDVILGAVLPVLPRQYTFQAIGLMGSLLMPHTILVQSALVNSRHYLSECPYEQNRQRSVVASYINAENAFGLTCAFLVNAAVLLVFSAAAAKTSQQHEWTLSNAGLALESLLGPQAYPVWAIGLIASGMNASIAGCFAGQLIMNGFLDIRASPRVRIIGSRLVTILPVGLAIAFLSQQEMDVFLSAANAMQAILLPYVLVVLGKMLLEEPSLYLYRMSGFKGSMLTVFTLAIVIGNVVMLYNELDSEFMVLFFAIFYAWSLLFLRLHPFSKRRLSSVSLGLQDKLLP